MRTITAEILVGIGHPDHDGIMPGSIWGRLQLIEGDRITWVIGSSRLRWLRRHRSTNPPRPGQTAMCGLLLAWVLVVAEEPDNDGMLGEFLSMHTEVEGDLSKVAKKTFLRFWRHVVEWTRGKSLKLIVVAFEHSRVADQLGVFDEQFLDFELLIPTRSRLYSRWLRRTVELGLTIHGPEFE